MWHNEDGDEQAPAPTAQPDLSQFVPLDRFKTVTQQKREAEKRIAELEAERDAAKEAAGSAEALRMQLEDAQARITASESRYERHVAISGAGITDPSVVEGIEYAYSKLSADDRPAIADYVQGLIAEPDKAPTLLRPHLEAAAKSGASTARREVPPSSKGAQTPPVPASELTPQQIANMSNAEWKQYREAEMAKRGGF